MEQKKGRCYRCKGRVYLFRDAAEHVIYVGNKARCAEPGALVLSGIAVDGRQTGSLAQVDLKRSS
jgi:hypothetical protein